MDRSAIAGEIRAILSGNYNVDADELSLDTTLDALGVDLEDLSELVGYHFDQEIDPTVVEQWETVRDIVKTVSALDQDDD